MALNIRITDRVLVICLFVIISVMSMTQIQATRQNRKQIKLLSSAVESRRIYNEISTVCILVASGKVNSGDVPYTPESISQVVKECFDSESLKRKAPAIK